MEESEAKYFIQKKTHRTVDYSQQVQLNRTELDAIGSGNPDVVYYGDIVIPGTEDIIKLQFTDGDTDEITFDNTDIVGAGPMAGTFRNVLFNKVGKLGAALGEITFTGIKATLVS